MPRLSNSNLLWPLRDGAVAYPQHDEVLPASQSTYTIKGYAYSGGGRKVIRAEISFDQGQSWTLADINIREKPRWAAGSSGDRAKHWCWCLWEYTVDADLIKGANEICFRAFDQAQNQMPERPTWNVMVRVRVVHSHPHHTGGTSPSITTRSSVSSLSPPKSLSLAVYI